MSLDLLFLWFKMIHWIYSYFLFVIFHFLPILLWFTHFSIWILILFLSDFHKPTCLLVQLILRLMRLLSWCRLRRILIFKWIDRTSNLWCMTWGIVIFCYTLFRLHRLKVPYMECRLFLFLLRRLCNILMRSQDFSEWKL